MSWIPPEAHCGPAFRPSFILPLVEVCPADQKSFLWEVYKPSIKPQRAPFFICHMSDHLIPIVRHCFFQLPSG
jgi:hypothetical protein